MEQSPEEYDDPENEKKELEDSRRVINRLISELQQKYPLNVLTDEGVLPNYAFPEPGVTLRSVVKVRAEGPPEKRYETREYMRAASRAIKEFAPFAKFYADGRRVRVKQIDVGSKSQPLVERWRFCPDCNYMERLHQQQSETCPRCGCVGFLDTGQERNLIPFRRASAFSTPLDTIAVDETDDRELVSYTTHNLVDIPDDSHYSAQVIESEAFGYELLKEVTLREVNFGKKESGQAEFYVAGHRINEEGFVVCEECGACEEIDRRKQAKIDHQPYCKFRKTKAQTKTIPIMLYREITSEAIRILLPAVTYQVESARASFQAALQLGLRCHFGGDPGHLIIKQVSEPIPGSGDSRRNFLVLYDAVPGGTGYLADLCKGDNFLQVLEKAVKHATGCRCVSDGLDGCYRCLYGYQNSRDLPIISRRKALELLEPILKRRDELTTVPTLSDVSLESKQESELESRFVEALKAFCDNTKGYQIAETAHGGQCWNLSLPNGLTWRLKPQETVSLQDGLTRTTRPDFVLENATGAAQSPRVAIYLDGFRYHVCPDSPDSRLVDDFQKRQSLMNDGYVVWSLTWTDVKKFVEDETGTNLSFFDRLVAKNLADFCSQRLPEFRSGVCFENPVTQLLAFLAEPETLHWKTYVQGLLALYVTTPPHFSGDDIHQFEQDMDFGESLPDLPPPSKGRDERLAWLHRSPFAAQSISVTVSQLGLQMLDDIRAKLSLRDDWSSRAGQNYLFCWQRLLTTWNLLQFHPNTQVCCQSAEAPPTTVEALPELSEPKTEDETPKVEVPEEAGLEWLDEECWPFRDAMEREEIPIGFCGYPLMENGRVVVETDAELAWPDHKVVVVLEETVRDQYQAVGWKAYLPEQLEEVKEELKVG